MALIFQIVFIVIGTFISVILTKFLIQNGKLLAEIRKDIAELGERFDKRTSEMMERFDQRTAKIAELIVSEGEKTRELIKELRGF